MSTPAETNGFQGDRLTFGCSVIGPFHEMNSLPCQDACTFGNFPQGVAVIAVADGAGSAVKSDVGAQRAVNAAVNVVKETTANKDANNLDLSEVARAVILSARAALEETASELQCRLRDLACTLIVVVMRHDNVSVAHIGDGAVVAKTHEGLKILSGPEESEYTNETSFLSEEKWETVLRIAPICTGVLGIAAFTDGCQRAALLKSPDGLLPYDRFLEPIFSYASQVEDPQIGTQDIRDLLSSRKVCENSEDDKTFVISVLKTANQSSWPSE